MLEIDELYLKERSTDELEQFLRYPFEFVPNVHEKLETLGFEGNAIIMDSLIPLYEKAIQTTFEKIEKIHGEGGTHLHLHNMATAFVKMIRGLKEKCSLTWNEGLLQVLSNDLIERCNKIEMLFLPIYDIWRSQATHQEKRLLIKPYWYDFENNWWCTLNQHRYSFVETYNKVYDLSTEEYLSRRKEKQQSETQEQLEEQNEANEG